MTTSGGNSGGGAGPNSFGFWDAAHIDDPVGTGFGTGYVLDYVPYATSLISGDWFFVYFSEVHYGGAWDSTPDFQTRTATPNTVIDLGPGSISTFFGTNLDSGPRTIWSGGTGDTVQIAAVPEPSTLLLLPSAMLSCLVRSRRRK